MNDRALQSGQLLLAARSLATDRVLQACLGVYLVALVVLTLTPGLGGKADALRNLIDPLLLGVTLVGLLYGRSKLVAEERRFWDLLALAWACWLLVDLVYFFKLDPLLVSPSFFTDALYFIYYLIFALSIDLRPHLKPNPTLTALVRRLESSAGLVAVFGMLVYFALVVLPEPLGVSLSFVERSRGLTPYLLVRVALDVLLTGRLALAALSARGRWRHLYTLLAAGMAGYAGRDLLSLLRYEGFLPAAALPNEAYLYLPGFIILLAARYRHVPSSEADSAPHQSEERDLPHPGRPSPIGLYALVVPGVHVMLYPMGLLDPISRTPRDIFCLAYVTVLGTMAWVHQTVLAEEAERARRALRQAEESLTRSSKLEAVGRLAGGIAHDFNNYLTVISGYCELMKARLKGPEEQSDLAYVDDAARKASHLTRQLLAFGRRQVLRPEPLDLNLVVSQTSKMLDSLLGEDVALEVTLDPDAGLALADLGQTEQVLVNLAVNGRDAMPGGGTLSISTRRAIVDAAEAAELDIEPGSYAAIKVEDTGVGMSEDVRRQAFEPFFTTKEVGRGTGLGLSTVYGIVTQSGGSISVNSAPTEGTTIDVLLPSADASMAAPETPDQQLAPQAHSARILLVEDDGAVRRLATVALSQAGYKVRSASSGTEAVERFLDDCGSIDLLITDVLMPGMDGIELATVFQTRCPSLRVLLLSGYPSNTLRDRQKVLPHSLRLLEKPFSPSTLVNVAQEVLDDSLPSAAGRSLPLDLADQTHRSGD